MSGMRAVSITSHIAVKYVIIANVVNVLYLTNGAKTRTKKLNVITQRVLAMAYNENSLSSIRIGVSF